MKTRIPYKMPVAALLMAALLAGCSSSATQQNAAQGNAGTQTNAQAAAQPAAQAAPANAPSTQRAAATTTLSVNGVLALGVPEVALSFDQNAVVETVNAVAGQAVKQGDILATVDDADLQDAVSDAEMALKLLRANIAKQNAPPTKEEMAAAQASLNAAYASYSATKAGATQSEIENARRSWESAWNSYLAAQVTRDVHCGTAAGTQTTDCQKNEVQYGNAYESMLTAKANYDAILQPVSQATLTQAYSSVSSAKANLDELNAGVTETEQNVTAIQLEQAQAELDRAKAALAKATLVSPCDCIVQTSNVVQGVVPGETAFTLVNLSGMQFKTTNLVESDLANVKVGSTVSIRLRAVEQALTGKVAAILAQSTGTTGSTALYTVLIDLDQTDVTLLPGMTGSAEITMTS